MSAAGPRPPWICDESRCSRSRPRVTTRIGRRSPRSGAPRRLLGSLPRGANYSPFGGRVQSVAASLATEAASVGVLSESAQEHAHFLLGLAIALALRDRDAASIRCNGFVR